MIFISLIKDRCEEFSKKCKKISFDLEQNKIDINNDDSLADKNFFVFFADLLKAFKKDKHNEFKEFAKNLALFALKYKNEYDINDIKVFANLIKQNTDDKDRGQLKRAILSISLAKECIQNGFGFVDYEKFYINFREYMTNVF